jgi:Peptidase S24-like
MSFDSREEVRCSLAAEALRSWGVLKLRATGVSMLPTLWPGDILTVQSFRPDEVESGEIVLYMRQDRFFIHRVVTKNLNRDVAFLITRGDCMSENDPPVGKRELLGRITEVRRADSVFLPERKLPLFRRLLAFLFCHWGLFRSAGMRVWNYRYSNDDQVEGIFIRAAQ